MTLQTPFDAYKHAGETSDPAVQIVMLYDAAINYMKQAKQAINEDDHNTRYILVDKAFSIVKGLHACLDFSACEDVANAMNKYYHTIEELMVALQCNPGEELCEHIIGNLEKIRNTWKEIHLDTYSLPKNDNVAQ